MRYNRQQLLHSKVLRLTVILGVARSRYDMDRCMTKAGEEEALPGFDPGRF